MSYRLFGIFAVLLALAIASAQTAPAQPLPAAPPQAPAPGATPAPADAHAQLDAILKRPLYQRWQLRQEREAASESTLVRYIRERLDDLRTWLDDWIKRFFRGRGPAGGGAGSGLGAGLRTFFWVIAWTALVLLAVAIVFLIVRLVGNRRNTVASAAVLSREQVAAALKQGDALALAGDQWLDEAGRLAAQKHFRAMYRALYLALLSGLHTRGKIDFDRHRTNWTYVRRYRGDARERAIFSRLTDLFDSVWYGLKPGDGYDLGVLKHQVASLITAEHPPAVATEMQGGPTR